MLPWEARQLSNFLSHLLLKSCYWTIDFGRPKKAFKSDKLWTIGSLLHKPNSGKMLTTVLFAVKLLPMLTRWIKWLRKLRGRPVDRRLVNKNVTIRLKSLAKCYFELRLWNFINLIWWIYHS
jgi:hypothetical protein